MPSGTRALLDAFETGEEPEDRLEERTALPVQRGRRAPAVRFPNCTSAVCFSPMLASRSWISRVSSSWRGNWILVYCSVILAALWPAAFDAPMLHQPTRLSIVRSMVAFASFRQPDVGFLAGNVGSVAGFLEEPDIGFANRISRLGRKCREWQVFLG
jgi:hypothetical protein